MTKIVFAFAVIMTSCSAPRETPEGYAKNPTGCDAKPEEWYAEMAATQSGRIALQNRARDFDMRARFHETQVDFMSNSNTDRSAHKNKALQCVREAQWSLETLFKAGVPVK